MSNKIVFTPLSEGAQICTLPPKPAAQAMPDWYKNTKLHTGKNEEYALHSESNQAVNTTIKACTPFMDAMISGYIVELGSDVEFSKENGQVSVKWRTEMDLVAGHAFEQSYSLPRNQGEYKEALKWVFDWKIQTPEGYSCLYTHPFNRADLPFRTLTGVVDTDLYPESVHFPFQIFDFSNRFILEKGTPICQIIPFKRESWISETAEYVPGMKDKATHSVLSKIYRSYKSQFWHRKEFK